MTQSHYHFSTFQVTSHEEETEEAFSTTINEISNCPKVEEENSSESCGGLKHSAGTTEEGVPLLHDEESKHFFLPLKGGKGR